MNRISRRAVTFAVAALSAGLATSAHAEFKAEVKYAQVGDIKMAYYIRGQGSPLLMINGFASTMSLWDPALLDELSKSRTLILFDNRGVGLSTDTKENNTTIPQMADDAAGLAKALGYKKVDILGWSMGARISQQVLIRHPDLVNKAVLCAANPGGKNNIPADANVEKALNDPSVPTKDKVHLAFPNTDKGRLAMSQSLDRIKAAVKAGIMPDDFNVSPETEKRQDRARTTLWNADNQNFEDLKNIKVPVLLADGRDDIIDKPQNSVLIATQIPFSWLAFYDGGHAFLFQSYKEFAATVEVFLN